MPKLHLRTFQKKAYIDGDGTVVFPNAVEIAEGVIPDGGTLTYEVNGTDLQTQVSANATAVTALQSSGHAHVESYVYVDVARAGESYVEDGSEVSPYRSLNTAVAARLEDSDTDTVIFKLAPGDYVGTISIDKATANQKFEIRGSGEQNCRIMGSSVWDPTIGTVLYFRDFLGMTLSDCTVQFGKYGLYTRSITKVVVERVRFQFLGSSGINHSIDRTQAQMLADWSTHGQVGSNRSDGGATRIRQSQNVILSQCTADHTFRGFRLQNCSNGQVLNCQALYCVESGIYGASSSYDGAAGCDNLFISGCNVVECFNNGILIIGGIRNTVTGCRVYGCANSAITGWHTQDLTLIGNHLDNNVRRTYNGLGSLGDAFGNVMFSGKSNLTDTGGYMLTAVGNTMSRVGQGRHSEPVGFWFDNLDDSLTSYRCIIDNNNIACEPVYRDLVNNPIVTTATHYQSQGQYEILDTAVQALNVLTGTQGVSITTNTTNVTSNDVDILANQNAIGVNATNVTANTSGVATNVTSIATKQNTLTWSTVAADDTNPVTSEEIKSYVDANSGGSGATLGPNTFTGTQKIETSVPVLELIGANQTLQLSAGYGPSSLYVGDGQLDINGARIEVQATSGLRMPRFSSDPTIGTVNSRFGCVYYNTTSKKLFFHDDSAWVELATV